MAKENNTSLAKIISTAIEIPGVKVDRENLLREAFKSESREKLDRILEVGPVAAGCSRKQLKNISKRYVDIRTLTSTGASFVAGIPGGLAMAATIPADTLQFFAIALRLAQEIAYIYGADDLWSKGNVDIEKVQRQLILYCGVMFGVSGASATLRIAASAIGKQALKKIPRMALSKTFYYPIVKAIAKALGVRMTKGIFAKGVSKAIPVIGGVVSGVMTFACMRPMGNRLIDDFDEVKFDYSRHEFEADWEEVTEKFGAVVGDCQYVAEAVERNEFEKSCVKQLKEAKELFDADILTEDEYIQLKDKILVKMHLVDGDQ